MIHSFLLLLFVPAVHINVVLHCNIHTFNDNNFNNFYGNEVISITEVQYSTVQYVYAIGFFYAPAAAANNCTTFITAAAPPTNRDNGRRDFIVVGASLLGTWFFQSS